MVLVLTMTGFRDKCPEFAGSTLNSLRKDMHITRVIELQ